MASRSWIHAFGITALGIAAFAAACGDNGSSSQFPGSSMDAAAPYDGSPLPFADGGNPEAAVSTLTISPADDVLNLTGGGTTVQYQAFANGSTTPSVAAWTLDSAALGTISSGGLFNASGLAGGTIHVIATVGNVTAQTTLTINAHVIDNPSNIDSATMAALRAGGSADPNFVWLYPYDQTVFPRGLLPPLLQWAAATDPNYIYVHSKSKTFEYEGFYYSTSPPGTPQFQLPATYWTAITASAGESDPVTIGVTKMTGSAVSGPINETWTIAQGSLSGLIYYNTYDSPLAAGDPDAGPGDNDMGAVMRIKPGASQPEVLIGGKLKGSCTVCHTVSANGSVIAADVGHTTSKTYGLSADGGDPTPTSTQTGDTYAFGALTPDGKYLLSAGAVSLDDAGVAEGGAPSTFDDFGPNVVSLSQDQASVLYDTSSGSIVATLPNGVGKAFMPAFSPDGKQVVFNWYGQSQATLATMTFDQATLTFGTPQIAVQDDSDYLGWPSFLPDGVSFVYEASDDTDDYASYTPGYGASDGELLMYFGTPPTNTEHLYQALGVASALDTTTMDHDPYTRDPTGAISSARYLNYEPTVLPVASGGYYWVVFTSRRYYGNTITDDDPSDTVRKKLWIAAIDINADPQKDPSHPAFFLGGQELASGNLRGFFALPPCAQNGNTCETGSDCCTGFCRETSTDAGAQFVCVAPPTTCANEGEKCTMKSDCCNAADFCINGFCARPTPR